MAAAGFWIQEEVMKDIENPKQGWMAALVQVSLGAAIGSIIMTPFAIFRLADEVDKASRIYVAVEACRAGIELDACAMLTARKEASQ
jgi:hypothetical protein